MKARNQPRNKPTHKLANRSDKRMVKQTIKQPSRQTLKNKSRRKQDIKRNILSYAVILLMTVIFYGKSIRYGFSQDDFFFLKLSTASSLKDIILFFSPFHQNGFPFYRPLGTQFYFYIFRSLFGISNATLFMHIFMIMIQSINGFLVYRLLQKLNINAKKSLVAGILYATSSLHFLSLFYISATQQLLSATFVILTLIAYIDKQPLKQSLFLSLALLSKENSVVAIPIIVLIYMYRSIHKGIIYTDEYISPTTPSTSTTMPTSTSISNTSLSQLKTNLTNFITNTLRELTPTILVLALYMLMRISAGIEVQSEYHMTFNLQVISTIRWYSLFSLGIPELLLQYGKSGGHIDLSAYANDHGLLYLITTVVAGVVAGLTVLITVLKNISQDIYRTITKAKKRSLYRLTLYSILLLWWLTGIVLIVFFPNHRYPHYLDISLISLLIMISISLSRIPFILVSSLLLTNSFFAIRISEKTHWTTNRSLIVSRFLNSINIDKVCNNKYIYIKGNGSLPTELSYALSIDNGMQVICNNSAIRTIYQGLNIKRKDDNIQNPYIITISNEIFKTQEAK